MNAELRIDQFEKAALPHMNALYRTAARVVGNHADAHDVVQETYMQAWRSFDRFEPGTNCKAWLFKILFYAIHHHRRKIFRFNLKLVREEEAGLEERLAWEPPVSDTLEDREIVRAFEKLPARYREAVLLVDVQEFSYKEAADALGVPIGTIMSRLSRGRKLMREEIAECARSYGIGAASRREAVAS